MASHFGDTSVKFGGKNTYIRLSDILDLLKPLYQEYPYLEYALNSYMLDYFKCNKDILLDRELSSKKKKGKYKKNK